MSDALPKKRIRRGIDKDREDERESLLDRAPLTTVMPSSTAIRKNPSRAVPEQTGFHALSSTEIEDDFSSLEQDSSMITAPSLPRQEGGRERDRDKERYSCGVVKRSLRPPCAPESTLYKKIQRYFHWVNDPSLIDEDMSSYKAVVDKLHSELLELDMESIRWHANVNTVRAELSNMESSLGAQVTEQEALEAELCALLLREVSALEEIAQGVSHGTRRKASLTMEEVASRLVNFDSVLSEQLQACLTYSRLQEGAGDARVSTVKDPTTGEVLLCSYRPKAVTSTSAPSVVPSEVASEKQDQMEVMNSPQLESSQSQGNRSGLPVESGLQLSTVAPPELLPELPAIVAHVEDKRKKISELRPVDIFSETLHQSNSQLQALGLPEEVERSHNYFKAKRSQGTGAQPAERQRCEVETVAAAGRYTSTPLSAYLSMLQQPYKTGALEGLGVRSSDPPSTSSSGATAPKKGVRGAKPAANGSTGGSSSSGGEVTIAMDIDALRRTPCEVPLLLSTFSSLEGWYAGTYESLEFPLKRKAQSTSATTAAPYNITHQEHFMHPKFIQAGEKVMGMINTLSGAMQRAQIELADLEKEESEWRSQLAASGLALLKVEEALGAVREGARVQSLARTAPVETGVDGVNGAGALSSGVGVAGVASSSEREGVLGLLGMSAVNGNGADLSAAAAKKNAAKKKAAARRRR